MAGTGADAVLRASEKGAPSSPVRSDNGFGEIAGLVIRSAVRAPPAPHERGGTQQPVSGDPAPRRQTIGRAKSLRRELEPIAGGRACGIAAAGSG